MNAGYLPNKLRNMKRKEYIQPTIKCHNLKMNDNIMQQVSGIKVNTTQIDATEAHEAKEFNSNWDVY